MDILARPQERSQEFATGTKRDLGIRNGSPHSGGHSSGEVWGQSPQKMKTHANSNCNNVLIKKIPNIFQHRNFQENLSTVRSFVVNISTMTVKTLSSVGRPLY